MVLRVDLFTHNDCYAAAKKLRPCGIIIHSTAAPGVMAAGWKARWDHSGVQKCVHAFVDDREAVQTLPWTMRAWHCGGSGNSSHIGIEMCEPKREKWLDAEYFGPAWQNLLELVTTLMVRFNIPVTGDTLLSHSEAHKKGIASNHADVEHWWPQVGVSMDDFRAAAAERIRSMNITRINGQDRFATAAAISALQWPYGSAAAMIVGENCGADAASAAAQCAVTAPILLTRQHSVPPETEAELRRLGVRRIYVVGGESAVSQQTAERLGEILTEIAGGVG